MKSKIEKTIPIIFVLFFVFLLFAQTKLGYHSFSTLFLIGMMLLFFFLHFLLTKEKKKMLLLFGGYGLLVGFFFFGSYLHQQHFQSLVPGNFSYNWLKEALYFLKMSMPFMMLYVFSTSKVSSASSHKVIGWTAFFISISIVILNLICFSYGSYSDTWIKGNIFSWFTDGYDRYTFYHLASKGFFESANQIGAILLLFLPVLIYDLWKKASLKNFFWVLLSLLAMMMLGTKTAVLGFILIFIVMMVLGAFYTFFKKEDSFQRKNVVYFGLILSFYAILFPFTPIQNRKEVQNHINEEDTYSYLCLANLSNQEEVMDKITYIETHYQEKRLYDHFILNAYPYQYDPDFWYQILQLPASFRTNYRFLEEAMVKRVIEINQNPRDIWFGISYTRVQNIFNIERDFVMQYYSVGMLGTILFLGSYFVYLIVIGWTLMKRRFKNGFFLFSLLLGSSVLLAVSYYSGNLLNSFMVTPYLCLMIGYAYREGKRKDDAL